MVDELGRSGRVEATISTLDTSLAGLDEDQQVDTWTSNTSGRMPAESGKNKAWPSLKVARCWRHELGHGEGICCSALTGRPSSHCKRMFSNLTLTSCHRPPIVRTFFRFCLHPAHARDTPWLTMFLHGWCDDGDARARDGNRVFIMFGEREGSDSVLRC